MWFVELLSCNATWPSVLLGLFVVLMVTSGQLMNRKRSQTAPLPPGPRRFPILGNLHNLVGSKSPHRRLAELSSEHGPMVLLQLGQLPVVVASSPDAARGFLKTHDLSFADRPPFVAAKEMSYNFRDVALAPYGKYWRTMKKICVVELLTAKRVASFSHIRDTEVSIILDEIARAAATSEPVNLSKQFYASGNLIVTRAAFGNACNKHHLDHAVQIVSEFVTLTEGMTLADFFPTFESLIAVVTGKRRKMRAVSKKMDGVLGNIIEEHMSRAAATNVDDDDKNDHDQDFLDLLLNHYRLQDLDFTFSINDVKGVVLDMFVGGTDTSSSTLEWAMTEMIKNPDAMHKAQSEVRRIYQERGKMDESFFNELDYLKLVVKETFRLHPPAPLLIPRYCRETCEVNGYLIPAKTWVLVNAWAIGRDPKTWVNPDEFDPERFRDRSVDFKGTDYEFLPFGGGRRVCPGSTFALATIEVTLAKLLCHFNWRLPDGMAPDDLDMKETIGMTIRKKIPLRLVPSVYTPI